MKNGEERLITKRKDEKPGGPPDFSSHIFAINVQKEENKVKTVIHNVHDSNAAAEQEL